MSGQRADGSLTLSAFDGGGSSVPTAVETEEKLPSRFVLRAPYPNPSNSTTQIRFDLPEHSTVSIRIYDLQRRLAVEAPPRSVPAGFDRVIEVDGSGLASGVYLYQITTTTESGLVVGHTARGRIVIVR